ncbi:MAG: hypothetical protein V2A61_05240 [Calditrichota bacterium]
MMLMLMLMMMLMLIHQDINPLKMDIMDLSGFNNCQNRAKILHCSKECKIPQSSDKNRKVVPDGFQGLKARNPSGYTQLRWV